MYHTDFV